MQYVEDFLLAEYRFHNEKRYSLHMVCVTVLASGSKGNCTVVTTSRTRIVLDVGLSCREIVKRMRLRGEEPENLDAILITHEHQDHIQGLSVLARRWNVPVYATEGTHAAWKRWITPRQTMSFNAWLDLRRQQAAASPEPGEAAGIAACEEEPQQPMQDDLKNCEQELFVSPESTDPAYLPCVEHFRSGISFQIGDITVTPFTIPHDAADPVGFTIAAQGVKVAIATDLGYVPGSLRIHLSGVDLLVLESNHDLEMLRVGPYPWSVKQRVMGRRGHLSNEVAAEFIRDGLDGSVSTLVLGHISEHNNHPELVRSAAAKALHGRALFTKLVVAEPGVQSEVFCY